LGEAEKNKNKRNVKIRRAERIIEVQKFREILDSGLNLESDRY
jgi:hypothetical protein